MPEFPVALVSAATITRLEEAQPSPGAACFSFQLNPCSLSVLTTKFHVLEYTGGAENGNTEVGNVLLPGWVPLIARRTLASPEHFLMTSWRQWRPGPVTP